MTLFLAFPPIHYGTLIRVNAVHRWQAQSLTYTGIIAKSIRNTRAAMHTRLVYSVNCIVLMYILYISLFVCAWEHLPNVS